MARLESVDVGTAYGDGLEVGVTDFKIDGDASSVRLACIYDIGGRKMVAGLDRKQALVLARALLNTIEELGDE